MTTYAIIQTEASLDGGISRYLTLILSEANIIDALGYWNIDKAKYQNTDIYWIIRCRPDNQYWYNIITSLLINSLQMNKFGLPRFSMKKLPMGRSLYGYPVCDHLWAMHPVIYGYFMWLHAQPCDCSAKTLKMVQLEIVHLIPFSSSY